jgi:hypothetical protein
MRILRSKVAHDIKTEKHVEDLLIVKQSKF